MQIYFLRNNNPYPIFVLIDNVDPSMLKSIRLGPGEHWGANNDVIKAITVNISGCDTVPKVGTDLRATDVLDVLELPSVENNLK